MNLLKLKHIIDVKIRMSKFFSYKTNHKKLFFPGCSLSSGYPELVSKTYSYLQEKDPEIGIWLSCCGMPVKKFVGQNSYEKVIQSTEAKIKEGVEEVIVGCGNCYKVFGGLKEKFPNLKVTSLYSIIPLPADKISDQNKYIIHHPCPARADKTFKSSFMDYAQKIGVQIEKTEKENPLACCLVKSQSQKDKIAAIQDKNLLTYCGHCVKKFQSELPTKHILQIALNVETQFQSKNSIPFSFRKIKKDIEG